MNIAIDTNRYIEVSSIQIGAHAARLGDACDGASHLR